jgi:hypothetical protein
MNKFPKYLMATVASHQLGDLSRESADLCYALSETDTHYIGSWVFGLGFFNVKFPKTSTRELTEQERLTYDGLKLAMFGAMSGENSYDCGAIKMCDPDQ